MGHFENGAEHIFGPVLGKNSLLPSIDFTLEYLIRMQKMSRLFPDPVFQFFMGFAKGLFSVMKFPDMKKERPEQKEIKQRQGEKREQ